MNLGEWIAWVVLLLLALYGCAQLIRQMCLWFWRCKDVQIYRIAVPQKCRAVEPLLRCLQAQAAWEDGAHTYVLLPDTHSGELAIARRLAKEVPAVTPVDPEELYDVIAGLAETADDERGQ